MSNLKNNTHFQKGLTFLKKNQLKNGGFSSLSSPDLKNFSSSFAYHTNFTAALILTSLAKFKNFNSVSTLITSKLAQHLLSQRSKIWTWNYWHHRSSEFTSKPYPDDLDDTFVSLAALHQYDSTLIDGTALAQILTNLKNNEQKVGGPYYTWMTDHQKNSKWSDVDIVVNANIAYFLQLLGVELEPLQSFLQTAISIGKLSSPYYPTLYPALYFLSKNVSFLSQKNQLIEMILKKQTFSGLWETPLYTALMGSSLLRLHQPDHNLHQQIHDYLQKTQLHDGSWPAAGFCLDPNIKGKTHYAGAPTLTTTFVLEYFFLFQKIQSQATKLQSQKNLTFTQCNANSQHSEKTWGKFKKKLHSWPACFQPLIKKYLNKIQKADQKHYISTWSQHFFESLDPSQIQNYTQIKEEFLPILNLANLWGWLAYTIYDDIMDNDIDSQALPLGNLALIEFQITYQPLLAYKPEFIPIFRTIFHQLETANFQEIYTRKHIQPTSKKNSFPSSMLIFEQPPLTQLAHKSMGHALGCFAILSAAGFSTISKPYLKWKVFMLHYLTARQLNDDLHDWEKDLQKGNITPVVQQIVLATHNEPQKKTNKIFWSKVFPKSLIDISTQLQLAQQDLHENFLITHLDFFQNLLTKMQQNIRTAQHHQQLASYFSQATPSHLLASQLTVAAALLLLA